MLLTTDHRYRDDLIEALLEHQGEYLDAHHPSTSWATRYSTKFVQAVAKLYALFAERGYSNPRDEILKLMQENKIRACRGGLMTAGQLEYLFTVYDICGRARDALDP